MNEDNTRHAVRGQWQVKDGAPQPETGGSGAAWGHVPALQRRASRTTARVLGIAFALRVDAVRVSLSCISARIAQLKLKKLQVLGNFVLNQHLCDLLRRVY